MTQSKYIGPTGQLKVLNPNQNHNITFYRDGKEVGRLDFNGPEMIFSGDIDESAKTFLEFIAKSFSGRLKQERLAEREACAKFIEDGYARQFESPWREDLAAAIRASGETTLRGKA